MNDSELRARAETIWTLVFASDPLGRAYLQSADEETRETLHHVFVVGYIAGAIEHGPKEHAA